MDVFEWLLSNQRLDIRHLHHKYTIFNAIQHVFIEYLLDAGLMLGE